MRTWHGRPVWSTMKPAHLYFYVPCETETVNCGETCCLNSWTSALHVWTSFLLTTTHSLTHSLTQTLFMSGQASSSQHTHSLYLHADRQQDEQPLTTASLLLQQTLTSQNIPSISYLLLCHFTV